MRRPIDHVIAYGLLALLVLLVYRIFAPLFPALLWGFLLAIVCEHPYERLAGRLHGRRVLADTIFGVMLVMVLLLPALFFAWELIVIFPEIHAQIATLESASLPTLPGWITAAGLGPQVEKLWQTFEVGFTNNLPHLMSSLRGTATWALAEIGTFGTFLIQFALGAVISLFLLHHRFRVRAAIHRLLVRTGGPDASRLATRAFGMTRAAFAGVIVAALAQTALGSGAIYLAGLPVVLFSGFIFLLALVQIGPIAVVLVADTILIAEGSYLSAVLLTLWFLGAVMSVDNVVRPYFASKSSDAPAILLFLAAIGGLLTWGLIGVFVGPVLISILYEIFTAWNRAEAPQPDRN